jgi:O-antigen/teichoic acid export membrane protein
VTRGAPASGAARRAFGDTAIYFATIVAGQLTSLILLPVMTRYLGPAAFGQYALALAVTGLLGTIGSVWVRNVGMRLYFDHVPTRTTRSFFWTAACLQAAVMLPVLIAGYPIVRLAGNAVPLALYAWAGASVIVTDFYSLAANTLRAGHRAVEFGGAELTSSILRLASTWVGLAAGFRTPTMLFVFATASMAVASLAAMRGLRHAVAGRASLDGRIARELVAVGLPSIPASFGGWVIALSDRMLLAYFLDVRAVGMYAAAYGVADRAVNGLASGLFMTAGPAILREASAPAKSASRTISTYLGIYVLVTLGPSLLLVLEREFVLTLLTSAAFAPAADVIPYVVAGTWLSGLATYLNRPLELTKRYGMLSIIATVSAVLNLVLNLMLIPSFGVLGAAAGTLGAFAGTVLLSRALSSSALDVPIPWSAVTIAVAGCAAAGFVAAVIASPWISILLFVAVYGAIVTVALARLKGRVAGAPEYPVMEVNRVS